MQIDVWLVPRAEAPEDVSEKAIVIIDVLRATSVIVRALCNGASEVIPVLTVEEAMEISRTFPPGTTLLGGERSSRRITGFDLGNSPAEYSAERVRGKRLILRTTNGTRAFHTVASAGEVIAAGFLNIRAAAKRCAESKRDLLIVLSGDEGRFCLEDAVCGGMLIDALKGFDKNLVLTDSSAAALILYERFKGNVIEALRLSRHGKELTALGLEADLVESARVDVTDIVPIYKEREIRG
jgi:2-phosphosulfolactate phosphatase